MTRPNYSIEAKEGEFWKMEDYFEKVSWRNYVEQHQGFFQEGNVEGDIDAQRCQALGILVQDHIDCNIQDTLRWAVEAILSALEDKYGLHSKA